MEWIKGENKIHRLTSDTRKPPTGPLRVFKFFIHFHPNDENLTHRLLDWLKCISFCRSDESRDSMRYIDNNKC